MDPKAAAEVAQRYFGVSDPLTRLGWGISGYVFLSPDLRTAVKVHRHWPGFRRELEVYQRLRRLRITELHGLTVPKLLSFSDKVKLLQMDFVSAPYLLDFAGVQLEPPDFSDEVIAQWRADIDSRFGPNAYIAYLVYDSLAKFGMHYMDLRPTNVNVTGLLGAVPYDPSAAEDDEWD